jgi:hypothetical protein
MDVNENLSKSWWNTATRVVGTDDLPCATNLSQILPASRGHECSAHSGPFATICWWRGNGTYTTVPAACLVQVRWLHYTGREERCVLATRPLPFARSRSSHHIYRQAVLSSSKPFLVLRGFFRCLSFCSFAVWSEEIIRKLNIVHIQITRKKNLE